MVLFHFGKASWPCQAVDTSTLTKPATILGSGLQGNELLWAWDSGPAVLCGALLSEVPAVSMGHLMQIEAP